MAKKKNTPPLTREQLKRSVKPGIRKAESDGRYNKQEEKQEEGVDE